MGSSEAVIKRTVLRAATVYAALLGIAWCALFPIAWAVSGSLKTEGEVSEPTLVPARPRWSNYTEVFALMPIGRMFVNTVLYAGCVTAGHVFFCSWPDTPSPDWISAAATRCSWSTWAR